MIMKQKTCEDENGYSCALCLEARELLYKRRQLIMHVREERGFKIILKNIWK